MISTLNFGFSVEKKQKTVRISGTFPTDVTQVWNAWTQPSWLDLWWGPEPWKVQTLAMDFREGGHWHYAMVAPTGEKHYSRTDYIHIAHEVFISQKDSFCNEKGEINSALPSNEVKIEFTAKTDSVLVEMVLVFASTHDLQKILDMGFQEGIQQDFEQLYQLLRETEKP